MGQLLQQARLADARLAGQQHHAVAFARFAAEMLRRIRYHWDIPEIAQMGVPGVVRIHFFIERDGRVTGLEIERESGHPPMDFAARDAILNASPAAATACGSGRHLP